MKKEPIKILELADTLSQDGKYQLSLENYIWCFENAEKEDSIWKSAKLGACLEGWYNLSQQYQPALDALENKKNEIYKHLKNKYDTYKFVEYIKICAYLKIEQESINLFKFYDKENIELAKISFEFIYGILVQNREWSLCSKYLLNSLEQYALIVERFDELMRISEEAFNDEYNQVYQDKFIEDIETLFTILEYGNRQEEIDIIKNRLEIDLKNRGGFISD